jgi:DAACS family dicarboxylate/amino acid:cation (Na+ or H+) symporter
MPLHRKILVGLVAGAVLGLCANALAPGAPWLESFVEYVAEPVGRIFIRLLLMLVIPLVFSALVMGLCELELRDIGRLGLKTLALTAAVSLIAVVLGMVLVNLVEPGRAVPEAMRRGVESAIKPASAPEQASPIAFIVALFPDNPIRAAAQGDMLAVIVFSVIFGIGLTQTRSPAALTLRQMIQGLFDVMMRIIHGVLGLAPFGVAALVFTMTARTGISVLASLAAYVLVVIAGLALHMGVVYSAGVRLLGGMSPLRFFRGVRLAMATAFSTASSNATLPTALEAADELGLPRHVSRFVLTAGASMNQNGTALFEGVTVLFLAQAYGVELSLAKQAVVLGIAVLAGIGTAGVPAGSLPVIAMILGMLGVPPEGLGLVLGVDRFLDMARTVVNVTGDLAVAVCVSRGEKSEETAQES